MSNCIFCRRHSLALAGLCLVLLASDLPRDPSVRVLEALAEWRELAAPEKAWVLTDKEVYLAGETVGLAGFVFDGVTNWPGTPSAVLYVDLVDVWGAPVAWTSPTGGVRTRVRSIAVADGSSTWTLPIAGVHWAHARLRRGLRVST